MVIAPAIASRAATVDGLNVSGSAIGVSDV
jgi:hypothetical protein